MGQYGKGVGRGAQSLHALCKYTTPQHLLMRTKPTEPCPLGFMHASVHSIMIDGIIAF